jgi:GT2 family glycosyltransferase
MEMSDSISKPVSIVLPNYNGKDLLAKNLPYILSAASRYSAETEVIVVDDASTDDSAEYVRKNFPDVRVLQLENNVGFADASDQGIRAATGHIVVLLNTDVRVSEDFIMPLVTHFAGEDVFAVTSMSYADDENTLKEVAKVPIFKRGYLKFVGSKDPQLRHAVTNGENQSPIYSFYAVGGHSAIDKSKYLTLGGFDDLYYPFYSEDVDLCYRAWKRGWKTIFESRSIVYHSSTGSIHTGYLDTYRACIIKRNRFLFVWKNITSNKYFYGRHILPTFFRIVVGIFVLDFNFYRAFFSALSRLPQARQRRKLEKNCSHKLSDEKIFEITSSLLKERN